MVTLRASLVYDDDDDDDAPSHQLGVTEQFLLASVTVQDAYRNDFLGEVSMAVFLFSDFVEQTRELPSKFAAYKL